MGNGNYRSMTYSLSNNCTKNYYNRTLTFQVIVEDVVTWIFFKTHCMYTPDICCRVLIVATIVMRHPHVSLEDPLIDFDQLRAISTVATPVLPNPEMMTSTVYNMPGTRVKEDFAQLDKTTSRRGQGYRW